MRWPEPNQGKERRALVLAFAALPRFASKTFSQTVSKRRVLPVGRTLASVVCESIMAALSPY